LFLDCADVREQNKPDTQWLPPEEGGGRFCMAEAIHRYFAHE